MEMLFSQEEVWEMTKREIARDAKQERDMLYGELQRRLDPLGRVGELMAALGDTNKLAALAQEFGLQM